MTTIYTNDAVAVVAFDKHSGRIHTVTSVSKKDAQREAKYFRSIGYNARVLTYEQLDELQEQERQERLAGMTFEPFDPKRVCA